MSVLLYCLLGFRPITGQSPNHADWGGERAALGRRLVGDGGTRRPGPTLGLVRAEAYGAGCHSVHLERNTITDLQDLSH